MRVTSQAWELIWILRVSHRLCHWSSDIWSTKATTVFCFPCRLATCGPHSLVYWFPLCEYERRWCGRLLPVESPYISLRRRHARNICNLLFSKPCLWFYSSVLIVAKVGSLVCVFIGMVHGMAIGMEAECFTTFDFWLTVSINDRVCTGPVAVAFGASCLDNASDETEDCMLLTQSMATQLAVSCAG